MKHLKPIAILLCPVLLGLAACNTTQTQPAVKAAPMTMQPYSAKPASSPQAGSVTGSRSVVTLEPDEVPKAPEPARNDVSPFASTAEPATATPTYVAADTPVVAEPKQSAPQAPVRTDPRPAPAASAVLDAEARAFIEETRSSDVKWQILLSRFDANGDGEIDAAEYARYKEWHGLRASVKGRFDRDGDGNLDPGTRNAFREAVKALNNSYFVNPE